MPYTRESTIYPVHILFRPEHHAESVQMPRLRLEERTSLRMWAIQAIEIVNKSSRILYVDLDTQPLRAVDPGRHWVHPVSNDTTTRFTLSYYDRDTREMEYLCTKRLFNKGRLLHILE